MLKKIFVSILDKIISLKLGLDVYEYLEEKNRINWRDLEEELHIGYPIKGTSIKLDSEMFKNWEGIKDNHRFINNYKDLGPHEITEDLASEPFKYKEMTFLYLFTILEDFGNQVVEFSNEKFYQKEIQKKGKSWHSSINKFAKSKNKDLVSLFALPFNLNKAEINENIVNHFYELKQKRNSIAHKLEYPNIRNFKDDINTIFLIICYLYYMNEDLVSEFEYYPYFDYDRNE